jgi:hypothetical protein
MEGDETQFLTLQPKNVIRVTQAKRALAKVHKRSLKTTLIASGTLAEI